MGIQNRDYYRNERSGEVRLGMADRSMCQILIIINVAAFLLQIFITITYREPVNFFSRQMSPEQQELLQELSPRFMTRTVSVLEQWGQLDRVKVEQGQIWRLLTYAFLHSRTELLHIIFNMMALYFFGTEVEARLGRREFLAFYLLSAIFSGLCYVLFEIAMRDYGVAIGASGAVMAVTMLFAIYYPKAPIQIYFLFTIEARWLVALYVIYDSLPTLNALAGRATVSTGIAHAAHLGGLAFGYAYYRLRLRLTDWLPHRGGQSIGQRLTKWWTRPNLRVYDSPVEPREAPPPPRRPPVVSPRELERRVDEILKKIKDQGEASLTNDERDLLRDASQAYKKRNTD